MLRWLVFFGYELDLTQLTSEEKAEIKEQVAFIKASPTFAIWNFYRLESPFEGNDTAWMFVSKDQTEAMVFYFRVLAEAAHPLVTLKLAGLAEEATYQMGRCNICWR